MACPWASSEALKVMSLYHLAVSGDVDRNNVMERGEMLKVGSTIVTSPLEIACVRLAPVDTVPQPNCLFRAKLELRSCVTSRGS